MEDVQPVVQILAKASGCHELFQILIRGGDEPDIDSAVVYEIVEKLIATPDCGVSTAMVPIFSEADFNSPHVVKVVCDPQCRALYFSRSPIPSASRVDDGETLSE